MQKFISAADFAKVAGVSKMAISKAINEGRISQALKQRGKRFLIHSRVAEFEYLGKGPAPSQEELNEIAAPWPAETKKENPARREIIRDEIPAAGSNIPPRGPAAGSFAQARMVKEQYVARIKKMEYETMTGQLIPAELVQVERFKQGRMVRDAVLNIPNRIASALAAALGVTVDAHKVAVTMDAELRNILQEIANGNKPANNKPEPPFSA